MTRKNNGLIFIFLFTVCVFFIPFVSSCNKSGNASKVGFNTQLEILNLSPDLNPVNLYIAFIKQNTSPYYYSVGSGYFFVKTIDTPIQIRSAETTNRNIITLDSLLRSNHKYSIFITGLVSNNSVSSIFTLDDTASIPPIGYGKLRVVNAAIQNTGLDFLANGTHAFPGVPYKKVTPYINLPAGDYKFQINPTGSPTTILNTPGLQVTTIQDGRLYTLYTYGIVNGVDSAAFGAAMITNR